MRSPSQFTDYSNFWFLPCSNPKFHNPFPEWIVLFLMQ
jgi:hypothetical protein